MPIYEFRCPACGERFESLVAVGTATAECRACGAMGAERVLSAQAAPMSLVKPSASKRRQEARNASLRSRAKAEFKSRRKRAREARGGGG